MRARRWQLAAVLALVAAADAEPRPLDAQLPEWARARWRTVAKEHALELSARLNPFLQRGDFDGDGTPDAAMLVKNAGGKIGIVVLHRGSSGAYVLGAGTELGNGGDDFEWMDVWSVEDATPSRRREALRLEKEGSGGGLASFESGRYRWTQHGD